LEKLKIHNMPKYLSPSALMTAEGLPNTFYMTRLCESQYRVPREEQSLAAGVGSAFDYLVKMWLAENGSDACRKKLELVKGLKGQVECGKKSEDLSEYKEAWEAGKKTLEAYMLSCLPYNKKGFTGLEKNIRKTIEGVPMYGMMDAEFKGAPFDWKVSGYTSKTGVSPKPRYFRLWDGLSIKGAHKKYVDDIPFNEIDEKWAIQVCTYGWLNGVKVGTEFDAYIDMLCWGKGQSRVRIAQYKGKITADFQEKVIYKYKRLWKSLQDGSFVELLAHDSLIELVALEAQNENWF